MYSDHYGLTDRPFQLGPDARFYFRGVTHGRAIDRIETALTRGEGCIVVTGESGVGKTVLAAHLVDSIDVEAVAVIRLRADEIENGEPLAFIARGLGATTQGSGVDDLLDSVATVLSERARRGKRTVFIVDDAEKLTVMALQQLARLFDRPGGPGMPVQIVLLGRSGLQDRLALPTLEPLRRHVIVTHMLTGLGAEEIEPYLHRRLTVAGWVGIPSFTTGALNAIYAFSGGIPRRINMVAGRLLLLGAIERLKVIDEESVAIVVADFRNDPAESFQAAEFQPPEKLPTASILSELPLAGPHMAGLIPDAGEAAMEERIARIESQLADQEAILRRVLTLLVDWIEQDEDASAANIARNGAP